MDIKQGQIKNEDEYFNKSLLEQDINRNNDKSI